MSKSIEPKIICYSSGGIDLQINGALGTSFNELTELNRDRLPEICQYLWQSGVDGFLPTLVTTSIQNIHSALAVIQPAMERNPPQSAQILGVHLECCFFHPTKRGAHPQEHLLPLNLSQVQAVIGEYGSIIKLITIAPELDPTGEVIPYLVEQGIVVSLGHSTAIATQAHQAFNQGAKMITHAFNAMPALHHREPGLLGEALLRSGVWCGVIADGVHVHPQMVDLLVRLKGQEVVLVSDALAPLGLPDGFYPWDDRQIEVKNGTARLADGTLSGTTLSLFDCVKNLVRWGICSPELAIALATESPRQVLNLAPTPKSLAWYWRSPQELAWVRLQNS